MEKTLKRIRRRETEKELWVEGEFVTEQEMAEELHLSPPRIAAIKEECQKHKGHVRPISTNSSESDRVSLMTYIPIVSPI